MTNKALKFSPSTLVNLYCYSVQRLVDNYAFEAMRYLPITHTQQACTCISTHIHTVHTLLLHYLHLSNSQPIRPAQLELDEATNNSQGWYSVDWLSC